MLSQIESGTASPSLKTLEYLANKLEIPLHYLISNESEKPAASGAKNASASDLPYRKNDVLINCKSAYIRGDFSYIISHADELDDKESLYYDEGAALLARAYLKTAYNLMKNNMNTEAISNARMAARYGEAGIYASRDIRTEALLLLDELS
jgi:transcriptional regulator with XRE-family HTH domain